MYQPQNILITSQVGIEAIETNLPTFLNEFKLNSIETGQRYLKQFRNRLNLLLSYSKKNEDGSLNRLHTYCRIKILAKHVCPLIIFKIK